MMKHAFSSIQRPAVIEDMSSDYFDVLIIGGGITGAGIALDAQTRGLKTGLIERQDFAAGTSSRSTKLIHGGLRYLKQFEIKEVAEIGRERAVVYENAPHVTTPLWMLLPVIKDGSFSKLTLRLGLTVYDRLAGVNRNERHYMLNKKETLNKVSFLSNQVKGGGYYVEYRTDDARLTLEVMKKAVEQGVKAINYIKADEFMYENGRVKGVQAVDQVTGERHLIRANKVINAAGPWVDTLREKDQSKKGATLHLTKGVHFTIDQKYFPLEQAVYFDEPEGRMIFAIPREGKVYIGTTETDEFGNIMNLRMNTDDRDYLLKAVQFMFPSAKVKKEHIESSWAGVRPLVQEEGKDPSEISRQDETFVSDSGLISIAGGKLTGYRKMAERVVDLTVKKLKEEKAEKYPKCQTKELRLSGGNVGGANKFTDFVEEKIREGTTIGLSSEEAKQLAHRYGSNVDAVYTIIQTRGEEAKHHQLSQAVFAMVVYGMEHEMTVTPADFFIRRSGALFFHIDWVKQWKEAVIQYMAQRLQWTEEQRKTHADYLNEYIQEAAIAKET